MSHFREYRFVLLTSNLNFIFKRDNYCRDFLTAAAFESILYRSEEHN